MPTSSSYWFYVNYGLSPYKSQINIWNISSCPVLEKWIMTLITYSYFNFPFHCINSASCPRNVLTVCDTNSVIICKEWVKDRNAAQQYNNSEILWFQFCHVFLALTMMGFCNMDSHLAIIHLKKSVRSDCIALLGLLRYYLEEVLGR